jgi:hypothetical protein
VSNKGKQEKGMRNCMIKYIKEGKCSCKERINWETDRGSWRKKEI